MAVDGRGAEQIGGHVGASVRSRRAPVGHVTQGTIDNTDLGRLVAPTLRALADEDVLVIASTGGPPVEEVERALGGPLPANARVAEFLPHDLLLPHCSAVVTNGGFGGVQRMLANGVPLVVAGSTEDKPEVAARVAWAGCGRDLRTGTPRPEAIRRAVRDVLTTPSYRARSRELAATIAALPDPLDVIAAGLDAAVSARRGRSGRTTPERAGPGGQSAGHHGRYCESAKRIPPITSTTAAEASSPREATAMPPPDEARPLRGVPPSVADPPPDAHDADHERRDRRRREREHPDQELRLEAPVRVHDRRDDAHGPMRLSQPSRQARDRGRRAVSGGSVMGEGYSPTAPHGRLRAPVTAPAPLPGTRLTRCGSASGSRTRRPRGGRARVPNPSASRRRRAARPRRRARG